MDIKSIILTVAEIGFIICFFVSGRFFFDKAYQQLIKVSYIKNNQKDVEGIYQNIQILLTISCLILCLLVLGINGWLIVYKRTNLMEYHTSLIKSISWDYFIDIGIRIKQM